MATYNVADVFEKKSAPLIPDWRIRRILDDDKDNLINPSLTDVHTVGLSRYPAGKELQCVIDFSDDVLAWVINSIAFLIQQGYELKDGDVIEGVFEDMPVKLQSTIHGLGKTDIEMLRIIVPDTEGRFPDDVECENDFKFQLLATPELYGINSPRFYS